MAGSGDASPSKLHSVEWVEAPAVAEGCEGAVTVLGDLALPGLPAESHRDLAALAEAIGDGDADPATVLVDCRVPGGADPADGLPGAARAATRRMLELLQGWVAEERFADRRLVLLTTRAVATCAGESPDLRAAALWGLARSALAEHPGRIALLDLGDDRTPWEALEPALESPEPQLALRDGAVLMPRLAPARTDGASLSESLDPDGTVLVTGGTGGLGAFVARHLAAEHGVRNMLLASRRGRRAEGADALESDLDEIGCATRIEACDVSDRAQLKALIDSVSHEHPLTAVVHMAAVLDDGVLGSLTGERVDHVMRPKVDAAWYLHELTEHLELGAFVLFSSIAGAFGGAGQGNYAAANTFLDALASYRQASGLPAVSLAWGLWDEASDLAAGLTPAERARTTDRIRERLGAVPMPAAEGLGIFDAAMRSGEPLLVTARLDGAALSAQAATGRLPALLRSIVATPRSPVAPNVAASFVERLAGLSPTDRERAMRDLVRGEVAAVLGHASASAIDPSRAFKDLGFDSLAAVELCNRLGAVLGRRLPTSLPFDHPTPAATADCLLAQLLPDGNAKAEAHPDEATVRQALASIPLSRLREAGLMGTLMELAGSEDGAAEASAEADDEIDSMDIDDLVARTLERQVGE